MTATKKKKQNINHELRLGGCIAFFTSPLILFAFILGVLGFIIGLRNFFSHSLNYPPSVSLTMMVVFAVLWLILIGVAFKFIRRFQKLRQIGQHLKAEQERVAHLGDTSAIDRLKDKESSLNFATKQEQEVEQSKEQSI